MRQPRSLRPVGATLGLLGLFHGPPAVADTKINVDNISANGFEVRGLSCALTKGGLFGSVLVVGSLAKQKRFFDGCAPDGAAFAVEFTWAGGRTAGARVIGSSQPKRDACMVTALRGIKPAVEGKCSAVLLVGKVEAARKAADALGPAKGPGTPDGKPAESTAKPVSPPDGKAARPAPPAPPRDAPPLPPT